MNIEVLKSKIHRVRVTHSDLDYIGSIGLDRSLMEEANIIEGEKVDILNINNGERFHTYVIVNEKDEGDIIINGPAARRVQVGDLIIIVSYAMMDFEEAKEFTPAIIFGEEE